MATDELTFRISGLPDFWAEATKEVVTANTTLLDAFNANANGEVILHGWSPKVFDFMMKLLHYEDGELHAFFNEFEAEVKDVWSIASFHEKFIRHAHATDGGSETHESGRPTMRMRRWFRRWYHENGEGFRGALASDLTVLVMPAFYIGDARAFMSVTHDAFLHTNGRQASFENVEMPEESDQGGVGAIETNHPLLDVCANLKPLGQLAAARANMIGKIEKELYYDEKKDGLPRGRGGKPTECEDPDWCPKLKSAAYYKALRATGYWPARGLTEKHSIHQILTMIENTFDYVNYDNRQDVPDRDAARAHMPASHDATQDTKNGKRCRVCVNAAVKASFDRKMKSLIKRLLDEKKTWITVERRGRSFRVQMNDSFAGLCLDCITKTKFGCEDEDYWNHCLDFEYDHGCTVTHGQPTWYFSYLGRPEDMKQYQKKKKALLQRHGGP